MLKPLSFISVITLTAFLQCQVLSVWALPMKRSEPVSTLPVPELSIPLSTQLSTLYLGKDPYTQALLRLQYDAEGKTLELQLLNHGHVLSSQSHALPENTLSVDTAVVFKGDQMVVAGRILGQRWFIRALNSQGEFQWQRQGAGQVYDLAFSDDGQVLYAAGTSAKQPLLMVVNGQSGVIGFDSQADSASEQDQEGSIYKQVVVTGEKEIVVAQHRQTNGQLQYLKWRAVSDPASTDTEEQWQTIPDFCQGCELMGVVSVALKNDRDQGRFFAIASDGDRLEFSMKDSVTGASLADQIVLVEAGSGIWDGILRVENSENLNTEYDLGTSKIVLTANKCKIQSVIVGLDKPLELDLCSDHLIGSIRKLLEASSNMSTLPDSDEDSASSENRHFMNLEWFLGIIGTFEGLLTVAGLIAAVLAVKKHFKKIDQKRIAESDERDSQEKEREYRDKERKKQEELNKIKRFNSEKKLFDILSNARKNIFIDTFELTLLEPDQTGNLIDQSREVSLHTESTLEDLFYAIRTGDFKTVAPIIQGQPMLVHDHDKYGITPLHLAVEMCDETNYHIIPSLLEKGADTDALSIGQVKPLHLAVKKGCTKVTQILLNWELTIKPDELSILYHIAARNGHSNLIRLLMDKELQLMHSLKYLSISSRPTTGGQNILHEASVHGHLDMLESILINKLAGLNSRDEDGNTALHLASIHGHIKVVEYLLNQDDIKVDEGNIYGLTPLHVVVMRHPTNTAEIVKKIIPKSNVNAKSKDGRAPLHFACEHHDRITPIKEIVMRKDADPNIRDKIGRTPLHILAANGVRQLKVFVSSSNAIKDRRPVLIDAVDSNGNTPLHIATLLMHDKRVKDLIGLSADKTIKNKDNKTPLEIAEEIKDDKIKQEIKKILTE